ncbi:hypothetical protein KAW50_00820 [candidate division WOR-3 bacterium]|nr:hypothetical protein [candidate division WOR-3 bacterium]
MINELILFILLTVNSGDTTDIDSVFADTTADSILANTTIFIDKKDLEWMPISEILAQQIGIVKTGTGLHFRGGDIGEEVFFVDGIEVTDPVYRVPYIAFNRDAISEMSITLDGFDAEYGNSSSGTVNILTKEGTEHYDGEIRYFTNTDIGEHRCNLNVGGPFPLLKNITFFASGNMDTTDNHSPSILPKPNNALCQGNGMAKINWKPISSLKIGLKGELLHQKYKIYDHRRSRGAWFEDWPLCKFDYSAINLFLTHNITRNTSYTVNFGKTSSHFKASSQGGKSYNEWKTIGTRLPWVNVAEDSLWYNPETKKWKEGWSEERAWMWYYENINKLGYWNPSAGKWEWNFDAEPKDIIDALEFRCYQTGTYLMSSTSREGDELIYTRGDSIYIYYHKFNLDKYVRDLERYVADEIGAAEIEPSGNLYMTRYNTDEWGRFEYNFYPFWEKQEHLKNFANFSFASRIGKYNKVKLGGSLKKYEMSSTKLNFINRNPYLSSYEGEPRVYAVYLSDKIKCEELKINAGIRLDCFDPASECFIHLDSLDAGKKSAETKYGVSPRIKVAFHIFDKSVIYVNYGHFYKPHNFAYLYQNLNPALDIGWPTIGNPDLPLQKLLCMQVE